MSKLHDLVDLIKRAAQAVESSYFLLPTSYERAGIVRERVFCYELYHQMRSLMTDANIFSLSGEIDKRGHLDIKPKHRYNPDFVFHIPGIHSGNAIIMEVKGNIEKASEVKKDFHTLHTFIKYYKYQLGIFLMYNHSLDELIARHSSMLQSLRSYSNASSIHIIAIESAGSKPVEVLLIDL